VCEQSIFLVEKEDTGTRLDVYVAGRMAETSRNIIRRWIDAEQVTVDGVSRKASYVLSRGQEVVVVPLPPDPIDLIPENLPLTILYEDSDLIVVDKPADQVVHPGAGNRTGTLANALAYHLESISRKGSLRPGIVHRLDKGTSGVLVVAKNECSHERLSRQFQNRAVDKVYLALVFGRLEPQFGQIDVPIGRDTRSRIKISARTRKPRNAQTYYEVKRYLPEFSFLQVMPKTGRTHQIRVHLSYLGHPVVGDDRYGKKAYLRVKDPVQAAAVRKLDRLFLHASSLGFLHPRSKESLTFTAPLPPKLEELIVTLGK
jgi:23S rRNA pseudouridine1911/1915/1917 synthase